MTKSALVYCCQRAQRDGNVRRAMELARKMSDSFEVTMLLGDVSSSSIDVPDEVELVHLPALGGDPNSESFDIDVQPDLKERIVARRDVMLSVFERLRPRVLAIENFPFSLRSLRGEILPLVERARNGVYGDSLVVSVIDGILIDGSQRDEKSSDRAAELLDKYFDLVVVHSDPVFARLEEFFQPQNTLSIPLYHTGFVGPEYNILEDNYQQRDREILVTAGDGCFGASLYRSAIQAHKTLWAMAERPMKIVTGPQLPSDDWDRLSTLADGVPGLSLIREVRDIRAEMSRVQLSVSQCGYNTAINAMSTRTPCLFVPCGDNDTQEQITRAQRLVYWGVGRMLMPHHLNGASLANEMNQLASFNPRSPNFNMEGAHNAAEVIFRIVHKDQHSAVSTKLAGKEKWLH